MNKSTTILIAAIALISLVSVILYTNKHYRWLAINGISATLYSQKLFENRKAKTPDSLINKIIQFPADSSTVVYSDHWGFYSYAYTIKTKPEASGYTWSHLLGSWHVGKPKT